MENLFNIWQKQKDFLDKEKEKNPNSFFRKTIIDDNQLLSKIGITVFSADRPAVYLRLWPQDFIVEEISKDGQTHAIAYESDSNIKEELSGTTIYADLVKIGISTFDAVEELAKNHSLDRALIGYAGIKDRDGITSQLISFRNTPIDKIKSIQAPNFFLKNIYQAKGALQVGDLSGNRFTITFRGQKDFDNNFLLPLIEKYQKEGFWNFYYTQRFGTPRLISHFLGLLILKGQYEEALKILLTFKTPYEIKYFSDLRDQILKLWGDWQGIIKILEPTAYSFRRELAILNHLKKNPRDFLGALKIFTDQVQLWIFAYASYLFNRKLSLLIQLGNPPAELPLILNPNSHDWYLYKDLLEADELKLPAIGLRDFPSIQIKERKIKTRQQFNFLGFKIVPELPKIAVISFDLPKGSYATTFLAHLFVLSINIPILFGISPQIIDPKKILGTGNIEQITEIFKGVIVSKLQSQDSESIETASE